MRFPSILAALLAVSIACPAASRAQVASRDAFLNSDGVRIRYLVRGGGPPVVLVHGFMVNTELNWVASGLLDSLARRYTVIALDLRGHGASDKPHAASAYGTAFVDDVVRLLDHLRIRRAHIVGYSMGSAITLKLLTTYPERVISAVLGGYGWRAAGLGPPDGVVQLRAQLERAARGETTLADIITASDSIDLPPPVRAALNNNDLVALKAVQANFHEAVAAVPEATLRSNSIPVLVVVGERDWARSDAENMASVLSKAEVMIIPGATHVTTVTHPLLVEAVEWFLQAQ